MVFAAQWSLIGPPQQQVIYLAAAGKYLRFIHRPPEEQKGIYESTLMASQRPSHSWWQPQHWPCGYTAPPQVTSSDAVHHHGFLTPLLAGTMAGRERAAPHAASRRGPWAPPPWPASRVATAWLSRCRGSARAGARAGVRWHGANRNCSNSGTRPTVAATRLRPCTACWPVARPRRHAAGWWGWAGYSRWRDHSPHLCFKTVRATFAAHGSSVMRPLS